MDFKEKIMFFFVSRTFFLLISSLLFFVCCQLHGKVIVWFFGYFQRFLRMEIANMGYLNKLHHVRVTVFCHYIVLQVSLNVSLTRNFRTNSCNSLVLFLVSISFAQSFLKEVVTILFIWYFAI